MIYKLSICFALFGGQWSLKLNLPADLLSGMDSFSSYRTICLLKLCMAKEAEDQLSCGTNPFRRASVTGQITCKILYFQTPSHWILDFNIYDFESGGINLSSLKTTKKNFLRSSRICFIGSVSISLSLLTP